MLADKRNVDEDQDAHHKRNGYHDSHTFDPLDWRLSLLALHAKVLVETESEGDDGRNAEEKLGSHISSVQ